MSRKSQEIMNLKKLKVNNVNQVKKIEQSCMTDEVINKNLCNIIDKNVENFSTDDPTKQSNLPIEVSDNPSNKLLQITYTQMHVKKNYFNILF